MRTCLLLVALLVPVLSYGAEGVTTVPCKVRDALNLDTSHYKKHVSVEGFSIVASAKVSDYAMLEAAYLLREMLGHRKEILQEMAKNKVRYSIMAPDEFTTDVPEHSNLKPAIYWGKRARGLGADPKSIQPCVSCGEENILGFKGDPYSTESIFIHEFAHAVHQMGMNSIDPTFDKRLGTQYRKSIGKGLWKGTYAASNKYEYFAEGVQSWFDTNRSNDHDHGSIDTRKELLQYDPGLCRIIREAYGNSEWRYVKPSKRKPVSAHLVGFDRTKAPTFAWPEKMRKWYDDFNLGKVSLAPKNAVVGAPLSPGDPGTSKSASSLKPMVIYFHNVSGRSLILDWINFDGKPLQRSILRHQDHREPLSFVGHLWRLSDEKTGRFIAYFIVGKKPTRVTIHEDLIKAQLKEK